MLNGIHHVSAFTKSAAMNRHFYTEILGLRLVKNTVNQNNTRMRHLFYGDYQGNPGTLLTFFEIKRLGRARRERDFYGTTYLAVSKGSLDFWEMRLAPHVMELRRTNAGLYFQDADSFQIQLVETDAVIEPENATRHTDIPADRQVIRILGMDWHVGDTKRLADFAEQFLELTPDPFTAFIPSESEALSRMGRGSLDHVALRVTSKAEVAKWHAKAVAAGLKIEEFVDRAYFTSLYFREPNGLMIEIASDTRGFTIDEPVEQLGETLALPPFLEDKQTEIESNLKENEK
ncbi:glyoxalase/bleomycin resistance protein/dioxygenase [Listeria grandensis FSL F6-0971]|uniref:Glyoxalase/bleomycin resistance protein/dioxygenase n=1 Tax=Listeria grandensis FSL F6-0971 TaxID=1265819 RepID=W7BKN8_9LIST|nr:VOC family protein [Listeria grandensis]EUJ23761.1 glyoxalase/bleomycin resistance protein/dioxygenase [Listeria grandensis FSL F6-0971]